MKSIINEYSQIFKDIKGNLYTLFKFQALEKLMILLVMVPVLKYVPGVLMKLKGYEYLTNGVITKFLFSIQGVLAVTWIALVSMLILLIEIGGLILVSYGICIRSREIRFRSVMKIGLSKMKSFAGIGGIVVAVYFVVIMPWFGVGIHTSLLSDVGVPGFVKAYIYNNPFLKILYMLLIVVLVILAVFWIFSLHIIIFEKKSAKDALAGSMKMVRSNLKDFVLEVAGVASINLLIIGVVVILWIFMGVGLMEVLDLSNEFGILIFSVFIFLGILGVFLFGFVALPFQIHQLTRMYFRFRGEIPKINIEVVHKKSFIDKIFKSRKCTVIILTTVVLVGGVLSGLVLVAVGDVQYNVKVTAHRGASKEAPENTMAALRKAFEQGADYAEIDVQETKDGVIVLLHDSNLKRTTGEDIDIWEANYKDIKNLDNGSWFSEEYGEERIVTLDDVLRYTKGKLKLNIEIKKNGHEKNLVKSVIELMKKHNRLNSAVITSLDYNVITEVEKLEPKVVTGYVMYVAIGDLRGLKSDFYSIEYSNINDDFVSAAHSLGREVHVWTVNEKEEIENAILLGVDNIITDDVLFVKKELKDLNEKDGFFRLFSIDE